MSEPLLVVEDLVKRFDTGGLLRGPRRSVHALNGVTLTVNRSESVGLVGESGSGKSTLGRIVVRLTGATSGRVSFEGEDVLAAEGVRLRGLRRRMQMVFQDPYSSLNPRMRVGDAVAEGLEIHRLAPRAEIKERVARLFEEVGLDATHLTRFPHELSGGQRQRVGIARALGVSPSFLVCDEPVSALDVSIQAQVLNLLADLQQARGLALLFIAHDLAVVRQLTRRIAVMYFGRIVELADTETLLRTPRHPYTVALLSAVPVPDPRSRRMRVVVPGDPPKPTDPPPGCPFYSRCPHPMKSDRCVGELPPLRQVDASLVACHYADHPIVAANP